MQVTKELIENDIKGMESQLEQLKAQVAQVAGALTVLRNIHSYLDKPEPEPEVKVEEETVSTNNQTDGVTAKYVSLPPEDNTGIVTENQVGDNMVVDGVGKYHTVEENSSGS